MIESKFRARREAGVDWEGGKREGEGGRGREGEGGCGGLNPVAIGGYPVSASIVEDVVDAVAIGVAAVGARVAPPLPPLSSPFLPAPSPGESDNNPTTKTKSENQPEKRRCATASYLRGIADATDATDATDAPDAPDAPDAAAYQQRTSCHPPPAGTRQLWQGEGRRIIKAGRS